MWTTCSSEQGLQWAAQHRIRLLAPGTTTQTADILNYYRDYAERECGWTPAAADLGMAREFYIAPSMRKLEETVDDLLKLEQVYGWNFGGRPTRYVELAQAHAAERTYEYGHHLGR